MKSHQLHAVYLLIIAACYIPVCHTEVYFNGTCDPWSGPAGNKLCVKYNSYYIGYQWATCRTCTYIQTKSKGSHLCIYLSVTYCYYPCMLDVYGKEHGTAFSHCKCTPGDPVPTESTPLPAWCYSPDGTSCNWYRECLQKAYPNCKDDKDDYAIKYAEKFCQLYDEKYSDFSSEGKKWVDAVRKCLQVKLVPLIDTTRVKKTCAELKSEAFKTHTPCYLNPDQSSLSYCDLSIKDQLKVFWTIKSAFIDAFGSSLKGVLEVMAGCTKKLDLSSYIEKTKAKIKKAIIDRAIDITKKTVDYIIEETATRIKAWLDDIVSPFPLQLDLFIKSDDFFKSFERRKRSVRDNKEIERSRFAGKIVDAVASGQKWQDKGVAWFAYANNETEYDNNTMSIRLFVADRFEYEGIDNTSLSLTKAANITEALVQLSKAVLKGTLNLKIDGEGIEISGLNGCLDWNCEEHAFNITSLKPVKLQESNAVIMHGAMYTLLLAYFVLLLINSLFN